MSADKTYFVIQQEFDKKYKLISTSFHYNDNAEVEYDLDVQSDKSSAFPYYDNMGRLDETTIRTSAVKLPAVVKTNTGALKYLLIDMTTFTAVKIRTEGQVESDIKRIGNALGSDKIQNSTNCKIFAVDENTVVIGAPLYLKDMSEFSLSNLI